MSRQKKIELVKLILETDSEQVLAKVKSILMPSKKMDETARILSNPKMEEKLNRSIRQANEGHLRSVSLDEIWK